MIEDCGKRKSVGGRFAVVVVALIIAGCATAPSRTTPVAPERAIPTVSDLTLDEKIGQLFVYAAHGVYMNESSPAYRNLLRQVRENKVGGVIWFVSNVYETVWLTEKLQRESEVPLLISSDIEAGVGMRFTNTTYWPPAMAVGATHDPALAELQGRVAARESAALGINHILAPVADVNLDPENPVINARSFGEDPQQVGRFVSAFVRGVQSEGVLATAKHFPGHGDVSTNSHRTLPVLNVSRERLDEVELVPFRAAIDAGVASVMIGHLGVPALDPTPVPPPRTDAMAENPYAHAADEVAESVGGTVPATLSRPIIEGLLRNDLDFNGLVIADAFDMGALVNHYDPGEAAVRAIEAGEDMILKSPNTDAAIRAVKAAVQSGRLTEARIDESVRRILDAKRRVSFTVAPQETVFRTVDAQEHRDLAAEIARRAVTLVREEAGALPLRRGGRVMILTVSDFPELANPAATFVAELTQRLGATPTTFVLDSRSPVEDAAPVIAAIGEADTIVLALAVRGNWAAKEITVPEAARRAIAAIGNDKKTIAVSFGSPYTLRDFPSLQTYLCAYSIQPIMQAAAARALFGEAEISGKLPVTIPGLHARGEGIVKPRAAAPAPSR